MIAPVHLVLLMPILALRVAAYDELPLQPLLEGVSPTLETIRFGEQAICKSVKCVCFDSEAAKLWVARKLKPSTSY